MEVISLLSKTSNRLYLVLKYDNCFVIKIESNSNGKEQSYQ